MEENSKKMKSGLEKAPHRSLLYALGLTREEMERPLVGVVNAASEVVPGHLHLGKLAEAVKAGVRMAGGTASPDNGASEAFARFGINDNDRVAAQNRLTNEVREHDAFSRLRCADEKRSAS